MPTNNHSEMLILEKFSIGQSFSYKNQTHTIINSGKPRPTSGECKTDLYIQSIDEQDVLHELKISIKKDNYEFIENKPDKQRILDIFGKDGITILTNAIKAIEPKFHALKIVKHKKSDNSFTCTLGWKIEIFKNTSGKLAVDLNLTNEQKKHVLCGTNLKEEKKNSLVNGNVIANSGVANIFLEIPASITQIKTKNIQYFANKFQTFDELINDENFKINARFTALNYRSNKDKWDGNRPLAVRINWKVMNQKLQGILVLDDPFGLNGDAVGKNFQSIIEDLNIDKRLSKTKLQSFLLEPNIME